MNVIMAELKARHGDRCLKCGATEKLSVDHVVSRRAGGSDFLDNLQILCKSCNTSKGAKSIDYRQFPPLYIADAPIRSYAKSGTKKGCTICSRISAECRALIEALKRKTGLNDAGITELAVRALAEKEGITLSASPAPAPSAPEE